jgi:hypothetical protein
MSKFEENVTFCAKNYKKIQKTWGIIHILQQEFTNPTVLLTYFRDFSISFDSKSKTVYVNRKLFQACVIHIYVLLLNEIVSAELQNKTWTLTI